MHHETSSPHNLPQQAKSCQYYYSPSEISLELSLNPTSYQNKTKSDGPRIYNKKKRWNPIKPATTTTTTKSYLTELDKGILNINNNNNNNETEYWGCSTTLELYDNPWKIKKALTASDLGKLNRLLFGGDLLENLMLPVLGAESRRDAESGIGTPIRVWDADTMSMHQLILKRWASFKSYVLIGKWNQEFVRRRDLKKGDVIGLHWDSYRHCFNFSVLLRI